MKGFLSSKHKKFSFNFYKIVYLPFKIDYMDLKDRMILSIIQEDSTLSVKEISEKLVLLYSNV
jgi:hypothetical protein